jgi:hypothetical protein
MRLANDGFLYRDAIAEEIKSHIRGPHHNCEGWVQLKAPALPELDPVFEFARTWLECPKEDVRIVVRYNSSAQRVDVTISIKACVEFEVLYEPGLPGAGHRGPVGTLALIEPQRFSRAPPATVSFQQEFHFLDSRYQ